MASAYAYVRVEWEGQDLGDNIARMLNKRMRGRIEIGSVEWNPTALKKVITGGFVPVRIRNVKVWDDCALSSDLAPLDERRRGDPAEDCTPDNKPDPDPTSKRKPRKLLIDAPLVTAEIDVHAAAFGHHDLIFRNVHVHGGTALLEQAREPYPLHAYDRTIVSIITAFYPRLPPGFRAGIYAADSPPKFDLRDIHVHDVNVIVQFAPKPNKDGSVGYALTGLITGVNVDAMALPGAPPKSYLCQRRRPARPQDVRASRRGQQAREPAHPRRRAARCVRDSDDARRGLGEIAPAIRSSYPSSRSIGSRSCPINGGNTTTSRTTSRSTSRRARFRAKHRRHRPKLRICISPVSCSSGSIVPTTANGISSSR